MTVMNKKLLAIVLLLLLATGIAVSSAPRFLLYADRPVRTDAIVVFEGSDILARKKEAYQLRDEGYAGVLLVPASPVVIRSQSTGAQYAGSAAERIYPSYYENTHVEVLRAKTMMDAMGLKTATMVSSPYHLKRIRMIAGKVFGRQARLFAYVPARSVRTPSGMIDMHARDWIFVAQEYVKIIWFFLYSPFA